MQQAWYLCLKLPSAGWICFLPPILQYCLWKRTVCVAGFWVWPVFKALFTKAPWRLCAWPWQRSSVRRWSSTAAAPSPSSIMRVSHSLRSSRPAALVSLSPFVCSEQMVQTYPSGPRLTANSSSSENMKNHIMLINSTPQYIELLYIYIRRQIQKCS